MDGEAMERGSFASTLEVGAVVAFLALIEVAGACLTDAFSS